MFSFQHFSATKLFRQGTRLSFSESFRITETGRCLGGLKTEFRAERRVSKHSQFDNGKILTVKFLKWIENPKKRTLKGIMTWKDKRETKE